MPAVKVLESALVLESAIEVLGSAMLSIRTCWKAPWCWKSTLVLEKCLGAG